MTVQFAIALSSLLVEHEHLFALYQRRNYLANNLSALNCRSTNLYLTIVVNQQHLVKLNNSAILCVLDVVNKQLLTLLSLELLSVNFYNYVHLSFFYI